MSATIVRERAPRLAPQERREAILAATRPLLLEHGREATTKMVAEACGIAEGTIFRVFESKDALFAEVVERELDIAGFLADVAGIDLEQPVGVRLLTLTTLLQSRFSRVFALMAAMGLPRPPAVSRSHDRHELLVQAMELVLVGDRAAFRLPVHEVVRLVRTLTFAGTHPHISAGHPMTAEEIVDVVLHGVSRGGHPC